LSTDTRSLGEEDAATMNEQQARAEARKRNLDLGAKGPTDSYYLEVERDPASRKSNFVGNRRRRVLSGACGERSGTRSELALAVASGSPE
jgi:hypothetical protein